MYPIAEAMGQAYMQGFLYGLTIFVDAVMQPAVLVPCAIAVTLGAVSKMLRKRR